jgi:hypothetical protein
LRSIGYVASSGSGILVPNIVGLTTSAASSALSAVGLVLGSSTGSTSTGATSGNNGYVASQSVASGTYTDFGTTITYTTYSYTPPCSPSYSYSEQVTSSCNGCTYTYNLIATDVTCGTGSYVAAYNQTGNCTSNPQTDEIEELIGTTSTQCIIKVTKQYTNSCTGAITYSYETIYRTRACPTCECALS